MKKDQEAILSPFLDLQAKEWYGIAAPDLRKRGWKMVCLDAETGAEKRRLSRTDWEVFPETQILDADRDGRMAVRLIGGKAKTELWLVDGKRMEVLRTLEMAGSTAFGIHGGNSCVSQDGYWAALWPGKMRAWRAAERAAP